MKKYNEILKDIEVTKAAIKAAEKDTEQLTDMVFALCKDGHEKNGNLIERYKAAESSAVERQIIQTLTLMYLNSNARIALVNEIYPALCNVLKKYIGKQYGPKTKERIYNETKEAVGYGLNICDYSCQCYVIRNADNFYNAIRLHATNNAKVLIDNRIQSVSLSDLKIESADKNHKYLRTDDYVEDIPLRIAQLRKVHQAAVRAQEELKKCVNEFNDLATSGIIRINECSYIHPGYLIRA